MFVRGKATLWGPYRTPGKIVVSPDRTLVAVPLEAALGALDDLLEMSGVAAIRGPTT
jgi:hypothetical protein